MKSIIEQDETRCYICGRRATEEHHIFGASNRKLSTKYGLTVRLCHNCHNEPPWGVHHNSETDRELKKVGQVMFEREYPELDFMAIFGKNYRG